MNNVKCNRCGVSNDSNARYCQGCGFELPKEEVKDFQEIIVEIKGKRKRKLRKTLLIVGGSVFTFIVLAVLFFFLWLKPFILEQSVKVGVEKMNANCPTLIAPNMRMDSIRYVKPDVEYYYSLLNVKKEDFSENEEQIKEQILIYVQQLSMVSDEVKVLNMAKVNYVFIFYGKDQRILFEFTITPDMIKGT